MSNEFLTELKRIGQQVTDYIVNYPAIANVHPEYLRKGVLFYVLKGGKRLRPAMLLWACEAVGGDPKLALPAAAAIELSHTWTLVHDDIIDNDDLRRGGPSMHAYFRESWKNQVEAPQLDAWSRDLAMLVGDVQQAMATSMLNSLDPAINRDLVTWLIGDLAMNWVTKVLDGEMLDMEYSLRPLDAIKEDDILAMLSKKTASTLAWCGRTGVLLGINKLDPENEFVKLIEDVCWEAGLAFQLQDDILGIIGNEAELGKPVGSDICEGKRTVLVTYAYQHATNEQKKLLKSVLGNHKATPEEISAVQDILHTSGSIDYVHQLAQQYAERASQLLSKFPPSSAKEYLEEWISFITQRKY
ncbi:MAG: polyprenyl synthetase family protein [Patescibacteria group bacterium]